MTDRMLPVVNATKAWALGAVTLFGSGALAAALGAVVQASMAWLGVDLA